MRCKIVHINSRVFKGKVFISALILVVTFLTFPHRTSGPVLEISEAENDPLDQNIKVSKLSEKKEILQNVTTGLVYDLKLPTKEDADSKSLVAKILHFMWIGSQEVPGKYQENVIVWRNNNPTYEVGENYGRKLIKKNYLFIYLRSSSGQTT